MSRAEATGGADRSRPGSRSPDCGGQHRPNALDVVGNLQQQVLDRVELLCGPLPIYELENHRLPVEIQVGAVQDVGLDPALGAGECRVGADRDGGWQRTVEVALGQAGPDQPADVDAVGRDQPHGLLAQVRGGIAQLAAAVIAVHDLTTDLVRTCQDLGRSCDVARDHQGANTARGPATPLADVRQGEHFEAVLCAELAQGVDVAGVANTESGVLPDDHHAGTQRLDEYLDNEALRGPEGELMGELHDQHGVQPGGREQVQALLGRGDDLRGPLRGQDRDRARVAPDCDRGGAC